MGVPLGETYLATVSRRPPSGSGTTLCTPARPNVCSPTTWARPASSSAAVTTSAAPPVPVSTRTASGRSHAEREGSALKTCSLARAPWSLVTTPPLRNSSATFTPSAGMPAPRPAQVEDEGPRAGAPQRVEIALDVLGHVRSELGDLEIARALADHPMLGRHRDQPLADDGDVHGIGTGAEQGQLHDRSRLAAQEALAGGRGQGPRVAPVDGLDDVSRLDARPGRGRA